MVNKRERRALIQLLVHRVMVSIADLPVDKHDYAMQLASTLVQEALAGSINVEEALKSEATTIKFRQAVLDYDSN